MNVLTEAVFNKFLMLPDHALGRELVAAVAQNVVFVGETGSWKDDAAPADAVPRRDPRGAVAAADCDHAAAARRGHLGGTARGRGDGQRARRFDGSVSAGTRMSPTGRSCASASRTRR